MGIRPLEICGLLLFFFPWFSTFRILLSVLCDIVFLAFSFFFDRLPLCSTGRVGQLGADPSGAPFVPEFRGSLSRNIRCAFCARDGGNIGKPCQPL